MKSNFFIISLLFLFHQSSFSQTESLAFITDFDDAKDLAIKEGKFIFVDVVADWCQPCKKMDKEVYTDPEVINFFSRRYVSVKLDGEKRGSGFARKRKVLGYPTLLFFDPEGKEMHRIEGYADAQRLMRSAEVASKNPRKKASKFRNDYRKFSSNPKYLKDYIMFCEETEDYDLADKLSDQYVKHIDKVDSVEWMDFTMQFVHKEKSKLFDLLKENKSKFDALYGKEEVNQVFIDILVNGEMARKTNRGRELKTGDLIEKSKELFNKHKLRISDGQLYPAIANRVFNLEYGFKNDEGRSDLAVRVLKKYIEKIDQKYIPSIIASVAVTQKNKDILSLANDQLDKLLASQPSMSLHDIKSIILYKIGEKEEAFKQVALAQKYAVATKQKYRSSLKIMKDSGMVK